MIFILQVNVPSDSILNTDRTFSPLHPTQQPQQSFVSTPTYSHFQNTQCTSEPLIYTQQPYSPIFNQTYHQSNVPSHTELHTDHTFSRIHFSTPTNQTFFPAYTSEPPNYNYTQQSSNIPVFNQTFDQANYLQTNKYNQQTQWHLNITPESQDPSYTHL